MNHYVDPTDYSSARFLTNHQSARTLTEQIRHANGFTDPEQFRRFLYLHGLTLQDAMRPRGGQAMTGCTDAWLRMINNGRDWQ